ncbi:MAG: maleylpyruvate isomerase family mycothiol-dependent enzyme [Actinobacteria bacterium]|nr:maleylpyruvate isomerase family mycothiol-dependent enzyme [Actinomycetota bacterium]MBO0788418.1 maleylpyruvate isomerase family mycothiol-dependent enzyme [Actinomycetota bacterium]
MDIFDDLTAEQDRLEGILAGLDEQVWLSPSGAAGWTVTDVVLHLAQSEEAVAASAAGGGGLGALAARGGSTMDQFAEQMVAAERDAPGPVFERWQRARRAALAALRAADPGQPLAWVAAPVKPATLATTRLAEHWAHGLDITGPLGISFPDTERLRHVAWLAHRTLPYAMALSGGQPYPVYCDLTSHDGETRWQFGPPDAESLITGPAGAFCRVAAQRLAPGASGMRATGPHGAEALRALRTYAA